MSLFDLVGTHVTINTPEHPHTRVRVVHVFRAPEENCQRAGTEQKAELWCEVVLPDNQVVTVQNLTMERVLSH